MAGGTPRPSGLREHAIRMVAEISKPWAVGRVAGETAAACTLRSMTSTGGDGSLYCAGAEEGERELTE